MIVTKLVTLKADAKLKLLLNKQASNQSLFKMFWT
jgi:hypothetical protein